MARPRRTHTRHVCDARTRLGMPSKHAACVQRQLGALSDPIRMGSSLRTGTLSTTADLVPASVGTTTARWAALQSTGGARSHCICSSRPLVATCAEKNSSEWRAHTQPSSWPKYVYAGAAPPGCRRLARAPDLSRYFHDLRHEHSTRTIMAVERCEASHFKRSAAEARGCMPG